MFVGADAHISPMKITNSPRISVKQHILPGRCGHRPLRPFIEQTLSEFHTSNIQRAQAKRLARPIVRLGNPIRRPPEGRSLRDVPSVNGTQNRNAFSARQRYFASPASLFAYFFLTSQKKVCRRRHALCCAKKKGLKREISGLKTAYFLSKIAILPLCPTLSPNAAARSRTLI